MKLSQLLIVEWTVLCGLICHTEEKKCKEVNKTKNRGPKFTYLGAISNAPVKTDYFVTTGSATWLEALEQCDRLFNGMGGLVAVNSKEEWTFLTKMLGLQGDGGRYWTSGMWDKHTRCYKWFGNHADNEDNLAWDNGHPTIRPTDQTRILLRHKTIQESYFQTEYCTENYRAICEIRRN